MKIEKGSIVQKQDDPEMWGTVVDVFLHNGMLKIKASPESNKKTGVDVFSVHASLVEGHEVDS